MSQRRNYLGALRFYGEAQSYTQTKNIATQSLLISYLSRYQFQLPELLAFKLYMSLIPHLREDAHQDETALFSLLNNLVKLRLMSSKLVDPLVQWWMRAFLKARRVNLLHLKAVLERLLIMEYDNRELYELLWERVEKLPCPDTPPDYNLLTVKQILRLKLGEREGVELFHREEE